MDPKRWQRVKALFNEVWEYPTEEREIRLQQIEEDHPDLIEDLRGLIKADEASGEFMEKTALLHMEQEDQKGRMIGPYRIVKELGEGGMGEVFLAERVGDYQQQVAIKMLKRGINSEDLIHRFHVERQILADLQHPHIARLYDGGATTGGRPYLVMEYIEGKPLHQYCADLDMKQKIRTLIQICSAAHHAHQHGIIHQDIKPGNVMVTDSDSPKLLDFGIARTKNPNPTESFLKLMTLPYAAPEQIRGEPVTTATDIYALGVVLFKILTNRLPYPNLQDDDPELRSHIMLAPSPVVKNLAPELPRDLQVILQRCLQKNPNDRYGSVSRLMEDLEAFLAGDPISERRGDVFYVLRLKAFKSRSRLILFGLLFGAFLLALGWGVRQRWVADARVEATRHFGQKAERIEAEVRQLHMMPIHDIRPDLDKLNAQVTAIETDRARLGVHASAAGYTALGRAYLVTGNYSAAREMLAKAWEMDPGQSETALALGRTLASIYRLQSREAQRIQNATESEAKLKSLRAEYLAPALDYLAEAPEQSPWSSYILALKAYFQNQNDQAQRLVREAYKRTPWLYEAHQLEGHILLKTAEDLSDQGEADLATSAFDDALEAYLRSTAIAPSDERVYISLADYAHKRINAFNRLGRNESMMTQFELAMTHCQMALEVNPDSSEAFRYISLLHRLIAPFTEDEIGRLNTAVENAAMALRRAPADTQVLFEIGHAFAQRGKHSKNRGLDPMPDYQKALKHYNRIAELDPNYSAYNRIGQLYWDIANHALTQNEDPEPWWRQGIEAFENAITEDPTLHMAQNNLALIRYDQASALFAKGKDPKEPIDEAIRLNQMAYELASDNELELIAYNVTRTYMLSAQANIRHGRDPNPDFQSAESYLKVFKRSNNLNLRHFYMNLIGLYYLDRSTHAFQYGSDPMPLLNEAQKHFQASIDLEPNYSRPYGNLAQTHLHLARIQKTDEHLQKSRDLVNRSLEANPSSLGSRILLAETLLAIAEQALDEGKSPRKPLGMSVGIVSQLLEDYESDYQAPLLMGKLLVFKARWYMKTEAPVDRFFSQAWENLFKARALNPATPATALAFGYWALTQPNMEHENIARVFNILAQYRRVLPGHPELEAIEGALLLKVARNESERDQGRQQIQDAIKKNTALEGTYTAYLQ